MERKRSIRQFPSIAEVQRGMGSERQPDADGAVRAPEPGGRGARAGRGVDQPQARPPDALRQPVPANHLQGVSSTFICG